MQADKKLNIVIWAFPSWQGDYMKSTVELAKELAIRHNVLYIDYAYTVKDVMGAKEGSNIPVSRIMDGNKSLKSVKLNNGAEIAVLSLPPILPFNWTSSRAVYKMVEQLNFYIIAERIKTAVKRLNFKADVVVNAFNPFFGNAIPKLFPATPVIYYCYDNIDASTWASKHGGRLEKEFAATVNAAIFSSDALKENKGWKVPGHVVRNGVDLRIFNRLTGIKNSNPEIKETKKIIGYVGSIDERLDFDLLKKLAANNPSYDFHFIGRVITSNAEELKALPNVKFFGAVNPEILPGMMQHFEVGIIPFVKNEFTRNIYPMKVNEYLALGIPVVSTGFANINDLSGFWEIADDEPAFSTKIKEAIKENNEDKKQCRKAKAYTNSWQQKSLEFENILMHYAF